MEDKKIPTYKWVEEEGVEEITPIKRKIAKTMEVTETFNYYDALAYCMKMEKAVEDKKAEIEGLQNMIKAYREEIELIEQALNVTQEEENWNLAKQARLIKEEEEKKKKEIEEGIDKLVNEKENI